VSVLPIWIGRSRVSTLHAKTGEPLMSRSPSHGRASPDLTRIWWPVAGNDLVHGCPEAGCSRGVYRLDSSVQLLDASCSASSMSAEISAQAVGVSGKGAILPNGVIGYSRVLRNAVILPADDGLVGLRRLYDDRSLIVGLDLGEGTQRDGDRIELAMSVRLDILDGQTVVPILRP